MKSSRLWILLAVFSLVGCQSMVEQRTADGNLQATKNKIVTSNNNNDIDIVQPVYSTEKISGPNGEVLQATASAPSLILAPTLSGMSSPLPATSSVASSMAAEEVDNWKFRLTPYLWAASMKVDAEIGSQSADGTIDFSDIIEDAEFAGQLHFEAQNHRWIIMNDFIYMDLSDDLGSNSEYEATLFIGELAVGYQLLGGSLKEDKKWSVDVYGGNRYVYTDTEIKIGAAKGGSTKDFLDLIVGARAKLDLTKRLGLFAGGDIGGFDMGGSKFSWSALGGLGFDMSDRWRLVGGYRVLEFEMDSGSGIAKKELDIQLGGPFIGVTFNF